MGRLVALLVARGWSPGIVTEAKLARDGSATGEYVVCFGDFSSDPREALEALRPGHAFDLLVMDEIFSDMDDGCMRGSAAIRLLRAREETEGLARLAVISCTGNASHQSGQLLECRADLVWIKPFPSAEDGTMQRDIARLLPRLVRPDGERGANGAESARAPRTPKAGSCSESVF